MFFFCIDVYLPCELKQFQKRLKKNNTMNMREFWANEAAMMRDKSALFSSLGSVLGNIDKEVKRKTDKTEGDLLNRYYDENGSYLGTDNYNEGRTFLLKTSRVSVSDRLMKSSIKATGQLYVDGVLATFQSEKYKTEKIPEKFRKNMLYSFVEIVDSDLRKQMIAIAEKDTGGLPNGSYEGKKGFNSDETVHNCEHYLNIRKNLSIETVSGKRASLSADSTGEVVAAPYDHPETLLTRMHTHPSATKVIEVSGSKLTLGYYQIPSKKDLENVPTMAELEADKVPMIGHIKYVFAMRDLVVYMYDRQAIQAVLTIDQFKNL